MKLIENIKITDFGKKGGGLKKILLPLSTYMYGQDSKYPVIIRYLKLFWQHLEYKTNF